MSRLTKRGASLRGSGIHTKWTSSVRFVDTELDRPRWRFTPNYRIHHRTQVGIEFNPKAQEICPLLALFLLTEPEKRPAPFVGTNSDRIASPSGKQSYYVLRSASIYHFCTHLFRMGWCFQRSIWFWYWAWERFFSLHDVWWRLTHLLLNCFSTHYGVSLTRCMAWNLRRLIFCGIINILLQPLQLFS